MKKNKLLQTNNCLFLYAHLLNGNLFYAFEYSYYLDIPLIIYNELPKQYIINLWLNKYKKEIVEKHLIKVFFKSDINKIITRNLIILDYLSFRNYSFAFYFIIKNKIIYNYNDDPNSLRQPLKNKNIITFGDNNLSNNFDYFFPLGIYFNIFKEIKNFNYEIFNEVKINDKNIKTFFVDRKKIFKNHNEFFILNFYKKNIFDRANRLILECKYYNKEINIYNQDKFIDSVAIRAYSSWQNFDINNFQEPNLKITFKEFLAQID